MEDTKIAIVCIAKDEDDYLREWAEYHLKIGFSDIFLFQNNWRFKDKLDNRVHMIEADGHRVQNPIYNWFLSNGISKTFRWTAFIDADEFIYPGNMKICDALNGLSNFDSVYVHWRLFGDSGLHFDESGTRSVINRFTRCGKTLHRLGKHIVNTGNNDGSFVFNNPHILTRRNKDGIYLPTMCDPSGNPIGGHPWEDSSRESEKIEIYHFRNKTWEENIKRKYKTDDAFHESSKCDFRNDMDAIKREFDNHNCNEIENRNLVDISI